MLIGKKVENWGEESLMSQVIHQIHHYFLLVKLSTLTLTLITVYQDSSTAVSFTGSFLQTLWSLKRYYLLIQPFFGPHAV
jgi:hypothetical protein